MVVNNGTQKRKHKKKSDALTPEIRWDYLPAEYKRFEPKVAPTPIRCADLTAENEAPILLKSNEEAPVGTSYGIIKSRLVQSRNDSQKESKFIIITIGKASLGVGILNGSSVVTLAVAADSPCDLVCDQ